jgi:peptidoglycan hydrolase-like protein with peptidoglycan-binding domain
MAIKTYKKSSQAKVSANFKVSEFSCHGKGCCSETKIDEKLIAFIQKIRDHFGKSVTINSGYRCAKHNKAVGGATSSNHAKGKAADIVVDGVSPAEVAKYAESIGVLGIGLYETKSDGYFTHIDTRTKKSFWYGQKQEPRTTFGGAKKKTTSYSQTQFVKDVQKAIGVTVDGVAGPKTLDKTPTISRKCNSKHAVVKFIQKRLLALGYSEVGSADGIAGESFAKAVARFQKDKGYTADGIISAKKKTWEKLLGMC